jgi:hypothetical protein
MDRLNPQNVLANQTFQQKVLGNFSKVNFDLKPKYIEMNRPKIADMKAPQPNRKC